jgi:competence protein ComEC
MEAATFRSSNDAPPDGVTCDPAGCLYRRAGKEVAVAFAGEALGEDCDRADLILSTVPIRGRCSGPTATIDRFDVWREGAFAIWIEEGGRFRIESVAADLGDRPWVLDRMRGAAAARRPREPDPLVADEDPDGANQPSESAKSDEP